MKLQMLMGKVRKVCEMYDLIEDGDKIAVGVSGGKDSLTLLNCLADMRIFYPKKFEVLAIAVDLFNGKTDYTK
ncbi:MAG: tRNA 2-thiocytidine(32) synthetase TtcA, partial [Christensenellales bacterium]